MSSQWQGLLKNLGHWQGSFTQLSPQGEEIQDVPSSLSLELQERDEHLIKFKLQRFPAGQPVHECLVAEYHYPGPAPQQIPFLPTGAFSQGSLQWSPVSEFGAELALIFGDRRLRLVERYAFGSELTSLTLIREVREGSLVQASPPLTVSALTGVWEGEAITASSDARVSKPFQTKLEIQVAGDRLLQHLTFSGSAIESVGRITGNQILFDSGSQPMQVLLLPGGASALCPIKINRGFSFLLEAGWLIEPNLRQRLIRSYSDRGEWTSLTLVNECKVA